MGIVSTTEALAKAQSLGLDLIEVAGKTNPPVCRISDFGKYQYHLNKKMRKQKVRSKTGELKAVRIGLATASHDLEMRIRMAQKFLKIGHRVKIELKLVGRQKGQNDLSKAKLQDFLAMFPKNSIRILQLPKRNPRGIEIIIDKTQ